ncbi:MAG TPA: inositol monophosphatase family protein, partial [Lacipirellulaceae bacterium]|nr:inositol monophosphatase family protein [Lacipirellulaceae bacterium]
MNALNDQFIDECLETCEAAARAGGRELLARQGKSQAREKAPADLVTDADEASQEAIRRVIAARFPGHDFIGEEQPARERSATKAEFTWIVDPLDGTTNYVHGYPSFAVSVALAAGDELLVGVVYDPVAGNCFSAAARKGARCDGVPMRTSNVTKVGSALAIVSLPAHVQRDSPDLLDFIEASLVCQAVRRSGSAALNFAYLAKGALDAFWARHIHPWDVAAGVLLVREAGGVVTS